MAINLYDLDMGPHSINLSASTTKFQTSIRIEQDPNKSGVLSFLEKVETEIPPTPTSTSPQTVRPSAY